MLCSSGFQLYSRWMPLFEQHGSGFIVFTYHNMPNVLNMHPHALFRLRPFVFDFFFQGSEIFLSRCWHGDKITENRSF